MSFKNTKLLNDTIWIIDIWSFKIRVWICEIKTSNISLIWYWEKRQDNKLLDCQDFIDLEWISKNINDAISKAEKDAWVKIKKIIINTSILSIIFASSNYSYKFEEKTDIKDINKKIDNINSKILKQQYDSIYDNKWYKKNNLKLILQKKYINISENKKNIKLNNLNIFITESQQESLDFITHSLWKEVLQIVANEYCLLSLYEKHKNIVLLDLWHTNLSIIVKKDAHIIWIKKIPFWINDLIKKIRKNYSIPKNEIIKTIENDIYLKEKDIFLALFNDILTLSLKEILWDNICPKNFSVIWGWANNFIKNYLIHWSKINKKLNIVWKIKFINPDIKIMEKTTNKNWIDDAKSNINFYALMQESIHFIN
jgi:hypothetical protein